MIDIDNNNKTDSNTTVISDLNAKKLGSKAITLNTEMVDYFRH